MAEQMAPEHHSQVVRDAKKMRADAQDAVKRARERTREASEILARLKANRDGIDRRLL